MITSAKAYEDGSMARSSGRSATPPYNSTTRESRVLRGWWIAGWNDKDMELK